MRRKREKQQPVRDGESIKIGNRYLDTVRQIAARERKTQRVVVEEHLDLAFKLRRIPLVPAIPKELVS